MINHNHESRTKTLQCKRAFRSGVTQLLCFIKAVAQLLYFTNIKVALIAEDYAELPYQWRN